MLTKQKTIGKGSCDGEQESKGTQESCSANLWFMVMGLVSGLSLSNCCGIWSCKTHLAEHSRTVEYSLLCQRVQGESVPNKDSVSERPSFMPPHYVCNWLHVSNLFVVYDFGSRRTNN